MSPARSPAGADRGHLVPIGGAENKVRDAHILKRYVELCGEASGRIAVIATASELADTGERYERILRDLGAASVDVMQLRTRADCEADEALRLLDAVDGAFLTGGNQLRLSTTLGGTPVARRLRARNAEGMHVADLGLPVPMQRLV